MIFNMNMRTVLMIGVALLAAAATALFARGWLNAQKAAIKGDRGFAYYVLVAKNDTPAGHFIKAQDLRWQGWPKGALAPTYVQKGKRKPEDFDGAVVRTGLAAGQPVTDALVVRPGEQGFLAAVLEPGMRAVSIQVNAISGISGFVFPGDRVDMVLTHTVRSADGRSTHHVSETVLQDIRVLAVDQKTDDQKGKASVAKTVTFEVTPKQVEKIGIIASIGRISLSLRPIAREAQPEDKGKDKTKTKDKTAPVAAAVPAGTGARPGAVADSGSSLAPISSAEAAEPPAGATGAAGDRPVQLFDAAAAGPAKTAAPVAPAPKAVQRRERPGITLDSEVSRALTWNDRGQSRTVRVMHGDKTEEQKF